MLHPFYKLSMLQTFHTPHYTQNNTYNTLITPRPTMHSLHPEQHLQYTHYIQNNTYNTLITSRTTPTIHSLHPEQHLQHTHYTQTYNTLITTRTLPDLQSLTGQPCFEMFHGGAGEGHHPKIPALTDTV